MPLIDWKNPSTHDMIFADIRLILEAEGRYGATEEACQKWARDFIRRYVPMWQPGMAMDHESARLIGGVFERRVAKARRYLRKHVS